MRNKISLDAFTLKIIALITMTVDHIGYTFYSEISLFRIIGRISFVIFAFFIANGYVYTSNKEKHGLILLLFGIALEIPSKLFDSSLSGNIFLTLAIGYFLIYAFDKRKYFIFLLVLIIPYFYQIDYGYYGVLLIFCSYLLFERRFLLVLVNIILIYLFVNLKELSIIQLYSIFGSLLICLYNNERGRKMKYLFYIYYPLHLVVILLISMAIN